MKLFEVNYVISFCGVSKNWSLFPVFLLIANVCLLFNQSFVLADCFEEFLFLFQLSKIAIIKLSLILH